MRQVHSREHGSTEQRERREEMELWAPVPKVKKNMRMHARS
jgi:hypothetical protein